MRISTATIYNNAMYAMQNQQAALSQSQNEVSSGLKVQTPADDPAAMVGILQLQQQQSAVTQYGTNLGAVQTRLQTEEQSLSDTTNVIQQVYQLALQANNSALDASSRQAIATQLKQLSSQLASDANTKDSNGEYLFSGTAGAAQPFALNGSGNMVYSGTPVSRNIQIGADQYVQDADPGSSVYMNVPQGNGTFTLSAASTNTGTGVITGSVQNLTAWVPDNYTLSFTSPTTYQVTDSATPPNTVTSGTYQAGSAITFNGIQVTVTGTPAAGDTFAINKSGSEDMFTTINSLITALGSPQADSASQVQFQNQMNVSLQQITQIQAQLSNVTSSVGTRLSMLTNVASTQQNTLLQAATSLSSLQDANYAQSVTQLSQQYVGLQAAQQAYAKISQLSLFDYIK